MIYITGDTHGNIRQIQKLEEYCGHSWTKDEFLIICGDFGFVFMDDAEEKKDLDKLEKRPYTILFVDGNHENFPAIFRYPKEIWHGGRVHRIRKNILHLMRGQVFTIDGKSFFTFGGAASIDKEFRQEGISWWPEEIPVEAEYDEAVRNLKAHDMRVDYIVTHTMPACLIAKYTPYARLGPDADLTYFLDEVWKDVSFRHWYCGHWHDNTDEIDPKLSLLWYDIKEME